MGWIGVVWVAREMIAENRRRPIRRCRRARRGATTVLLLFVDVDGAEE